VGTRICRFPPCFVVGGSNFFFSHVKVNDEDWAVGYDWQTGSDVYRAKTLLLGDSCISDDRLFGFDYEQFPKGALLQH